MTVLHYMVIWIGTFVILVSFVLSLLLNKKFRIRNYMKGFYILPLIALLLSVNTIFNILFHAYNNKHFFLLQYSLSILDLIFWRVFFVNLFTNIKDVNKVKLFFLIVLILTSILFFLNDWGNPNFQAISIFNFCKTLFCILYFYKLFKDIPEKNITLEPSFWIVTGLFFYSGLSIPFYSLHNYIKSNTPLFISTNIFAISNMLIIIMHLFFIKAYLCTTRLHRAS